MIHNFKRNCLGTVDFDGQFQGMRKPQNFSVYPMHSGDPASGIRAQSDKRMLRISLVSGAVCAYPGKYSAGPLTQIGALTADELLLLKGHIMSTAHGKAGSNGIMYTDNSAALEVFGSAS